MENLFLSAVITTAVSIVATYFIDSFKAARKDDFELLSKVFSPLKYVIDCKSGIIKDSSNFLESINKILENQYYMIPQELKSMIIQLNEQNEFNNETYKIFENYIERKYRILLKKAGRLMENKYERFYSYLNTYLEVTSFPLVMLNILLLSFNVSTNYQNQQLELLLRYNFLAIIINLLLLKLSKRLSKKLFDQQ